MQGRQAPARRLKDYISKVVLEQIQEEIIETAHCEEQVVPANFARMLPYDLSDVRAAIVALADEGLVTIADDGTCSLTDAGEAFHRTREASDRVAVVARTRSWQSR
mgnify:CR=1 FL=1